MSQPVLADRIERIIRTYIDACNHGDAKANFPAVLARKRFIIFHIFQSGQAQLQSARISRRWSRNGGPIGQWTNCLSIPNGALRRWSGQGSTGSMVALFAGWIGSSSIPSRFVLARSGPTQPPRFTSISRIRNCGISTLCRPRLPDNSTMRVRQSKQPAGDSMRPVAGGDDDGKFHGVGAP